MNSIPKCQPDASACATVKDELNRYFTGKYMTARDFECDQDYFRSRNRLRNRLMDGWGVVVGLDVAKVDQETCPGWLEISPGLAIDPLGREIVVRTGIRAKLDDLEPVALVLCYGEVAVEPVPALVGGASCDPDSQEMNRVREVAAVEAVAVSRLRHGMWAGNFPDGSRPPLDQDNAPASDACQLILGGQTQWDDLTSDAIHFGVPIAYVWWDKGKPALTEFNVSTQGRRNQCRDVTRISALSWKHGQDLYVEDLKAADGALTVEFNAQLAADPGPGLGLGPETFEVHATDAEHRRQRVWSDPKSPPGLLASLKEAAGNGADVVPEDFATAVFHIDPEHLDALVGKTLHVTLKCDFILDRNKQPVDGAHVGGTLPTGKGSPGGSFESWFRLERKASSASDGASS